MKRGFMLGFVFILFSFSLVAAATCDDDQTIMRLYSPNNSHVSAWNELAAQYTVEVCHDDIFGYVYSGGDVHACTGNNRVLSLSNSSNAHASEVTDAVYDYEVCYGNLECVYDSSAGDSCSNEGEIVARMYSASNSHVSGAADTNYTIKVCCTSGPSLYWANANGEEIAEADFGDTVKLIARGLASGTFDIKENDVTGDDDIRSVVGESVDSSLVGVWTIESEDLDKTNDYGEFYFNINSEDSAYLNVNEDGDDDPMIVTLVSPACGGYYDEGDDYNIAVEASDSDDVIYGTISVDGEIVGEFTNGGVFIDETFDTTGTVQIVVEAYNTRGDRKRIISNVMVLDMSGSSYVDGDYVAACIKKPEDSSNIPGSTVEFDASTTRGVSVSGGVITLLVPGAAPFSWYWTFYPEGITRNLINSVETIAYKFTAEFPVAGDNSASLRVEI